MQSSPFSSFRMLFSDVDQNAFVVPKSMKLMLLANIRTLLMKSSLCASVHELCSAKTTCLVCPWQSDKSNDSCSVVIGFAWDHYLWNRHSIRISNVLQPLYSKNVFNKPYAQITNVLQSLCSTKLRFNIPCAHQALCSETLYSATPMLEKIYVHQIRRSTNPMWGGSPTGQSGIGGQPDPIHDDTLKHVCTCHSVFGWFPDPSSTHQENIWHNTWGYSEACMPQSLGVPPERCVACRGSIL